MRDYKKAFEELEKKLMESEERNRAYEHQIMKYQLARDALNIGLWDLDVVSGDSANPDNVIVWSQEIRNMFGFTDENDFPNALGSWSDRLHPDDHDRVMSAFEAHVEDITGQTPYDVEYRLQLKNGECRYFHDMGTTLRDEAGTPLRVVGAVVDVTAKKQLDEAIQNALEETGRTVNMVATILNHSGAMVYVADPDTDEVLFMTDAVKEHFGIEGEGLGQTCYELFQDGQTQRCDFCYWPEHLRDMGDVYSTETVSNVSQGYYRKITRLAVWPGNRRVRLEYVTDLTDIWKMQNVLRHNQNMLHAINSAASLLLNSDLGTFEVTLAESMQLLAGILGIDRVTIWKNNQDEGRQYASLLNVWSGNGGSANNGQIPGSVEFGDVWSEWRKVLARGTCINVLVRDLAPVERELLPIQSAVSFLLVPVFVEEKFWGFVSYDNQTEEKLFDESEESILKSGSVLLVNACIRNEMLTSMRETSTQLQHALDKAKIADLAKGNFLRTVSHEIRTPMNVILGLTEIHLQSEALENEIREAFDKIHISGDMLLGIINDILDMSKMEDGKLEVVPDIYDVASLISDTAHTNLVRKGSKPIEFELSVDENIPAVMRGDELRIKQILNNLLSNAFKYTDTGKVTLSFRVEAADADRSDESSTMLVFDVRDTGHGMSQEQLSKIFELYARFHDGSSQMIGGTGLGMPIVRNLLDLMDGEIEMESQPGQGSRFTVRIPQAKIGSGVVGSMLAESLQRFSLYGGRQLRRVQISREPMPYASVLVVDDIESNIYVTQGLLAPYGIRVDTALSGFEAIEKIESGNRYDIIFMDHMMPKLDGMEAMKIIKGTGYENPIVVLTADAVIGKSEMFLQSGFDDFISKPIDLRQLNNVLNKFIRDRYLEKAADVVEAARKEVPVKVTTELSMPAKVASLSQQAIQAFIRDASKSVSILDFINSKAGPWSADDRNTFEIHMHGMRSALTIIGQTELATMARKLEVANLTEDMAALKFETAVFIDSLRSTVKNLVGKDGRDGDPTVLVNRQYLRDGLLSIKAGCDIYDTRTVTAALRSLQEMPWPDSTQELLEVISINLLHSNFEEIVHAVKNYFELNEE